MTAWLGVVSADHVARGIALGIAQVNHGRRGPLDPVLRQRLHARPPRDDRPRAGRSPTDGDGDADLDRHPAR